MPKVPEYGNRKVGTDPLPGARQSGPGGAVTTPGAEGAGVGAAIENLGNVGMRAGLEVREVQHEQAERERQRRTQLFELSATRRANESLDRALRDPEHGVLNARGLDVMSAADTARTGWEQDMGAIAGDAKDDDERLIAERINVAYTDRLRDTIASHQDTQLRQYDDNEFKGMLASSVSVISATALHSPGTVDNTIRDAGDATEKYAQRNGLGPNATKALIDDTHNQLAVAAITQAITEGNPVLAKAFIDRYGPKTDDNPGGQDILTGEALARMQSAVKRGLTDDAAETLASTLWAQHGPKSDTDAISLDQLEELARAQTKGDPDLFKATQQALRSRKQATDDGRRERLETVNRTLWGGIYQGQSYAQVAHTPEGAAHPEVLAKIQEYLDSRAAQAEGREYTAETRAAMRAQRQEGERTDAHWGRYFELSRPESLRNLSEGQIMAMQGELGHELTGRLLQNWQTVAKSDEELRKARISDELFRETAYNGGFKSVYSSPAQLTGTEKAAYGRLRAAADDAIVTATVAKGSALTREETVAAFQNVIDQRVMIDRLGRPDVAQTAVVVDKGDVANAYVEYKYVPSWFAKQALTLIRPNNPAFQSLTDDQLLVRPGVQRAIERARAAHVLQLGPDEERRRLSEAR